jgi:hypothetical protein
MVTERKEHFRVNFTKFSNSAKFLRLPINVQYFFLSQHNIQPNKIIDLWSSHFEGRGVRDTSCSTTMPSVPATLHVVQKPGMSPIVMQQTYRSLTWRFVTINGWIHIQTQLRYSTELFSKLYGTLQNGVQKFMVTLTFYILSWKTENH